MAHANKTYVSNGQSVGITSLLPDGDAAPPATGLKLVGAVAHGNVVTIMSGSDVDFGNIAPDFYFIYRMENMTAGANLVLTRGSTFDDGEYMCRKKRLSYTTANQMPVHTVTDLPYDVGMPYGGLEAFNVVPNPILNPKMETFATRPYSSFYRFAYMQWPAANQINQLALHATGEQVKFCGDQWENGFSLSPDQSKADVYQGIYATETAGSTMSQSAGLALSNSGSFGGSQTTTLGAGLSGGYWYFNPTNTVDASKCVSSGLTFPANSNMNIYVNSASQRSSVMCYETFIVSGETNINADVRLVDTSLGVVTDIHDSGVRNPSCVYTKFDRFDTPKNVQGYNIPDNKHFYVNGTIQLVSDVEGVASCRVMIANTATPLPSTTMLSCCIPVYWSSHLIMVEIVEGIFWDQSLSGKYLHIYGAFNVFLGAYLIP